MQRQYSSEIDCEKTCRTARCCDYECDDATVYSWKVECPPRLPPILAPPCLTHQELYETKRDAVVRISTQTGITANQSTSLWVGSGLQPYDGTQATVNSVDQYCTFGNGFFVSGHYIVCPAHLVLLPPNITFQYSRYMRKGNVTKVDAISDPLTGGSADGSKYYRVDRILVDVFNVNGTNHHISYEAELVGVDGAADLAILRIPCDTLRFPWNGGLMAIRKCHPYLKFGSSSRYRDAEDVILIGDLVSRPMTMGLAQGGYEGAMLQSTLRGYVKGDVYNHRFTDPTGYAQPELVIVNADVYACSSGAPIISKYGKVIAMQTLSVAGMSAGYEGFTLGTGTQTGSGGNVPVGGGQSISNTGFRTFGDGLVGGPSQTSIVHSVYKLLNTQCGKQFSDVTVYPDLLGDFLYINHGYLGVAWELVTGLTYSAFIGDDYGITIGQYDTNGEYIPGPRYKDVVGVRIRALAGLDDNLTNYPLVKYIFVPGTTTSDTSNFVDSPLLDDTKSESGYPANTNDIIYAINGMPVGGLPGQAAPSVALWCLQPGSSVQVATRRVVDTLNAPPNSAESYDQTDLFNVNLATMPLFVNYPWYKYQCLPLAGLFSGVTNYYDSAMPMFLNNIANTAPFYPSI